MTQSESKREYDRRITQINHLMRLNHKTQHQIEQIEYITSIIDSVIEEIESLRK